MAPFAVGDKVTSDDNIAQKLKYISSPSHFPDNQAIMNHGIPSQTEARPFIFFSRYCRLLN